MRHEHETTRPETSAHAEAPARPAIEGENAWDCFTGPATLIPDDRCPPAMLPGLLAMHGFAVATEINRKLFRGLAGLPPRSGSR